MSDLCGAHGGCVLPRGHNMGVADISENHKVIKDMSIRFDIAEITDFILEQTDRSVSSDDFSHQQDAYDCGVGSAIDAIQDYFRLKGLDNARLDSADFFS